MDVRIFSTALMVTGVYMMTAHWLPAIGVGLIMSGLAKIQDEAVKAAR